MFPTKKIISTCHDNHEIKKLINGKALQGSIIYAEDSSIYTIQNCFFDNNTGSDGGAISATDYSNVTITNSTFTQNSAITGHGGGVHIDRKAYITFLQCNFSNHESINGGSIYFSSSSNCTSEIKNCTFNDSKSHGNGGFITVIDYM